MANRDVVVEGFKTDHLEARVKQLRGLVFNVLAYVIAFVIIIGGLEGLLRLLKIPTWVLPTPSKIALALVTNFSVIAYHFGMTVLEVLAGYALGAPFGIIMAMLLYSFPTLERALSPYIILVATTPLISLVPIVMLWLGFGIQTRIVVVFIQVFPIIMMISLSGMLSVSQLKIDLAESLGATKLQKITKVVFPAALPSVFTALTLGGIFASIAAVSAEFAGGKFGLGNRIQYFSSFLRTDIAFACILLLSLMGIVVYLSLGALRRKIIRWKL